MTTSDEQVRNAVDNYITGLLANQPSATGLPTPSPSHSAVAPLPPLPPRIDRAGTVAVIGGVVSLLVALVGGIFSVATHNDPPSPAPPVITNCAEQQRAVLQNQRDFPGVTFQFSGPSDEQCHLADLVIQLRRPG